MTQPIRRAPSRRPPPESRGRGADRAHRHLHATRCVCRALGHRRRARARRRVPARTGNAVLGGIDGAARDQSRAGRGDRQGRVARGRHDRGDGRRVRADGLLRAAAAAVHSRLRVLARRLRRRHDAAAALPRVGHRGGRLHDRPRDLRRDAASRADLRARDRARLDGRDRRAVPEPRVDAARHARCPRKTRSAGDAHHGRRRAGHRRAAASRRRPPTTSGTRCSPASTASTICSRSARPNRKISRSARPPCGTGWRRCSARSWAAHRRCRPTAPARKRSRRCSRVSRPRGRPPPTRWVKAPAVRRTRLRGWPMRAKACVWRSTVSRSAIRATKRRY